MKHFQCYFQAYEGHLKVWSAGTNGTSAMLELHTNVESDAHEISFMDVEIVEHEVDKGILRIKITMRNGDNLAFYATSNKANEEWLEYCIALKEIPSYPIPEFPKENVELLNQYIDPQRFSAGMYM